MARSMVKENKLFNTLWEEVIATAAYVLNRCPTKKLKEIIPFERWIGDKKSVIHFRVFDFVYYKHVTDATRKKLDDKSKVMLLVRYHSTSAYKLYYPFTDKERCCYERVKSMGLEQVSIQLRCRVNF